MTPSVTPAELSPTGFVVKATVTPVGKVPVLRVTLCAPPFIVAVVDAEPPGAALPNVWPWVIARVAKKSEL